ncbi:MAG TPA: phosphatidylserine decarboxylase [Thermoplasmata archaeon]|nr:phosphatidylserine decarboxylase [Thermoplasmata archaeon]
MFAPGGARAVGAFTVVGAVLLALGVARRVPLADVVLGVGGLLLGVAAFLAVFFRDPERPVGGGIVAPADGRVRAVTVDGGQLLISTFMNVTNVHVNRAPLDGTVRAMERAGAGFRAAFRPDADRNVRLRYTLDTAIGPVDVVQITGVVARRLVPFVAPGGALRKGERFGMIVLGSRVDLLLPADRARACVAVGAAVRAGTTTVAEVAA